MRPVETSFQCLFIGVFEAFTIVGILGQEAGWGLWRPDLQRPLEGDSREQHFTYGKCTACRYFP